MNATQEPAKARKKPVEIEFMLWEGGAAAATPIIDWVLSNGGTARYNELRTHDTAENETTGEIKSFERKTPLPEHIAIDTLEGTMRAEANDIIIRGVNGEFYPCKPDIFRKTYDVLGLGE